MFLGSAFTETLPAILLLVAFTVVGGVIIFIARKKMKSDSVETSTFSLNQLRKMLANGTITQEEFDKARESIVCMYKNERPISPKKS
ncbi:MAG: hypothetical protein HOI88_06850 [Phycisphaerae bacterium]|jgi:uncharacterized membrane protein|nr:hypothetical protein [Phycisphaerae bacterium]MBT6270050.1 hypothetical protein [Phycisphaerae bacterium]MBT7658084.1 hypothetical protein [Phycisphaerae bacterium]